MPDSLSLVWGHSVHFAKFATALAIIVKYRLLLFLAIGQFLNILWDFEIFNMGNLKCGISQKRLIVKQNERQFWTKGPYRAHISGTFAA